MKFRTAPAGNRELKVTVEMDQATVDNALKAVASNFAGRINIPGFRKSKVPYRVLERFVGRSALMAEAYEDLVRQALGYCLVELGITEPEQVESVAVTDEPTAYTFLISLEPYVELLPSYKTLRIEPEDLELTAEEKQEAQAELRERYASVVEVEDPIVWEDLVVLDIKGVILDENLEPTDEVVLEDDEWDVQLSAEHPLGPPNLEQEILGLKTGDDKQFVLTYPADSESVYAGKSAQFAIRVLRVSRPEPAPWNVKTLATALEIDTENENRTLEECEELFWQREQIEKAGQIFEVELSESLELLETAAVVEYADASVNNQLDLMVNEYMNNLTHLGVRDLETFLRYTNQTEEAFRESMRDRAEEELVHKLLIWEFIKLEDIQLDAELQASLAAEAARGAQELMATQADKIDENLTQDDVAEALNQQAMTANLSRVGRDALLVMYTGGVHSPSQFFEEKTEVMRTAVEDGLGSQHSQTD